MKSEAKEEPFQTFEKNMEKARTVLMLTRAKEFKAVLEEVGFGERIRQIIRSRPRLIPLLENVADSIVESFEAQIEPFIQEKVMELYELALPQILVFMVSCLEAYLKDNYSLHSGRSVKSLLNVGIISKTYGRLIHGDIFNGDEELRKDLQEILQTRHVIVHKGAIIDEEACEKVERWDQSMVNKEIKLNSSIVEGYLELVEKFGKVVHERTAGI
jgi:uncharacterized membrane-anchored protein YjiN (DUF445 family)